MKMLLDESVPWKLRELLVGHDVWTVNYLGWDSKSNGELLKLAREVLEGIAYEKLLLLIEARP